MLELNNIYNIDCINGLRQLQNNYVDICITSPPYKKQDGWSLHLMSNFIEEVERILKPNSLFFLNFGHLKEDKWRPFGALQMALNYTFKLNDTIIWIKNHFTPLRGNNLNNLTEFIFMLYKGKMPNIDRLSIGVPYKDKSNAKRYNKGQDLRCGGNVWYINIPTITSKEQRLHKDCYPLELPERCLKLANLKSDAIVLDPFCGSGTTCLAAKNLNFNFIGFEKEQKYYEISRKRLNILRD